MDHMNMEIFALLWECSKLGYSQIKCELLMLNCKIPVVLTQLDQSGQRGLKVARPKNKTQVDFPLTFEAKKSCLFTKYNSTGKQRVYSG